MENLRGYEDAALPIAPFSVLVGPNNHGKSSILRVADWLLNAAKDDVLRGDRPLSPEDMALLLPANQTKHRARRFSLIVRFDDARKARTFAGEGHVAQLRLSVEKAARVARVNCGPPRRNEQHDPRALALLERIRECCRFVLVPAARDARSERFRAALESRLRSLLLDKFGHRKQAGAPAEYRKATDILRKLEQMVDKVQADLWTELRATVPDELLQSSRLLMQAEPEQLSAWLRDRIALGLSTGPHDSDHVHPVEVGNGLQSILDVALSIAALPRDMRQTVLAIEEPEAFLHPSAQRTVAGHLRQLGSATQGAQVDVLVTSHSPYLVEEARFGETILVRNHRFYRPTLDATDAQRAEINTALMTVPSAEVFFARGLLLVEGEGDRALFQTLLRRIQSATRNPCLNQLVVHAVGGKKAFAPWWRLLASYGRAGDRPIRWLSVFDADAASNEGGERALLRGLADAGTTLDTDARDLVIALGDLLYSDSVARLTAARKANERLAEHDVFLFSVDSEWASFGALATTHGDAVADILAFHGDRTTDAAERLARAAGSKISTGKASQDAKKHPFRRQKLASLIPLDAIPLELKQVLLQWFELAMPSHDAAALLSGNLGNPAPVTGARRRR